jgi:hypothetical protein
VAGRRGCRRGHGVTGATGGPAAAGAGAASAWPGAAGRLAAAGASAWPSAAGTSGSGRGARRGGQRGHGCAWLVGLVGMACRSCDGSWAGLASFGGGHFGRRHRRQTGDEPMLVRASSAPARGASARRRGGRAPRPPPSATVVPSSVDVDDTDTRYG